MPTREIDRLFLGGDAAAAAAILRVEDVDCSIMILSFDGNPPCAARVAAKAAAKMADVPGVLLKEAPDIFEYPAIERGVVNLHPTVLRYVLKLTIADWICDLPTDALEDHLPLKMTAF